MLGVLLLTMLGGIGADHSWSAAMCFTGRNQWNRQPRHYFSECSTGDVDVEAFCEPYNVKFAIRSTPKPTRAGCMDVVRQNYPNLWRFRNRRVKPIICDPHIEGPPETACERPRSPSQAERQVDAPRPGEAPSNAPSG